MRKKSQRKLYNAAWSAVFAFIAFFFTWLANVATSTELPTTESPLYFYSTQAGDDLTLTYRAAIKKAKKSVLMIIYHLNDFAIIKSLKDKAAEGVDVTVLYDGKASAQLKKRLGANIRTLEYRGSGLMHQKILVVDKETIFLGSANMTPYSLRVHANLVAGLVDKQLADYISELAEAEAWELKRDKEQSGRVLNIGGQKIEYWSLPAGESAIKRILSLIQGAKKTIRVAMFTWTRQDFAQALIQAKLRGVDVQAAIDRSTSKGASAKVAKLLTAKGIPLYLNSSSTLLHHKFLYIDSRTLVNGSANWTKAAFTQNRDCFLVIHQLKNHQREKLEAVWSSIVAESSLAAHR